HRTDLCQLRSRRAASGCGRSRVDAARRGGTMSSLRLEFGVLLQRARESRRLTQTQLATRAGLSRRYVGAIERGEANGTMVALERLGQALGWNPFQRLPPPQDAGPTDIRATVRAALTYVSDLAQTAIPFIDGLEDATVRRLASVGQQSATPAGNQSGPAP